MGEELQRADFDRILSALKLTPDDIAANRDGKFTAANLKQLEKALDNAGSALAAMAVSVVFLGIVGVIVLLTYPQKDGNWFLLAVTGFFGVMTAMMYRSQAALRRDNHEQSIASADGTLLTQSRYSRGTRSYFVRVGDIEHQITQPVYDLLQTRDGEPFTVYYAPHSRTLLSLEPAEKSKEVA